MAIQGAPWQLDAIGAGGMPSFTDALAKGFTSMAAQYKPKQAAEDLLKQKLANAMTRPYAENADQMFQADIGGKNLNLDLLKSKLMQAKFMQDHPLLRLPGMAGQIGAMQYLDESEKHPATNAGGWHTEGHGSGYDLPPGTPGLSPSNYSNDTGAQVPTPEEALAKLPKARQDAIRKAQSGETPFDMTLTKEAPKTSYAQKLRETLNADLDKTKTLNDYRKALTESMGKRSSTSLGKTYQELADIDAGYAPGTNRQVQINPEIQEDLRGKYQLQMQKQVSDADARKKTLFASNIDKTIDSINKKDLTRFAGIDGAIKLKEQELKSMTNPGSESKEYRSYLENANKASLLAKQVRQFYGDSIQPAMLEKINKLTNPATWRNNPEIAMQLYDSFVGLLKQETGTYRGALTSTTEHAGTANAAKVRKYNVSSGRFE